MEIILPAQEELDNLTVSNLHYLPCKIHYNGPAPVSTFFNCSSQNENNLKDTNHEASFRGRHLVGISHSLGSHQGFMLVKSSKKEKDSTKSLNKDNLSALDDTEATSNLISNSFDLPKIECAAQFTSCLVWNQDAPPEIQENHFLKFKEYSKALEILMNHSD